MPQDSSSPTPKRPTLKDIAKAAGVSVGAASQAINPTPGSTISLPQETVERIVAIARKLRYRPHAGARSTRTNRFHNLGFFMAKRGKYTHLPDGYLAGLHDAADEAGYRVTLIRLPEDAEEVKAEVPAILDEHNLDALIIASYHYITKQIHQRLVEDQLPIVYLNDRQDANAVYIDDVAGSELMTRHLIQRGYRKICFNHRLPLHRPAIKDMHYSAQDRIQGYRHAMEEAGLEPKVVYFLSDVVIDWNEPHPHDWWPQVKGSEAIFAYDDELANRIARFLYDQGVRIPDDIALAGCNGDYAALSAWRRLTTLRIPAYRMGRAAFEMARRLIDSKGTESIPSQAFVPELIKGETA